METEMLLDVEQQRDELYARMFAMPEFISLSKGKRRAEMKFMFGQWIGEGLRQANGDKLPALEIARAVALEMNLYDGTIQFMDELREDFTTRTDAQLFEIYRRMNVLSAAVKCGELVKVELPDGSAEYHPGPKATATSKKRIREGLAA